MTDYIPLAAAIGCKSVLPNWADRNPKIVDGMMDGQYDNMLRLMAATPGVFYWGMHFYGPDEIVSHLDSYVARCKHIGIKPPTVIGTEFGIDSTGGTEHGYKSRPNYKDIYGQWMVVQVKPPPPPKDGEPPKRTLSDHIKSGVLGGLCVFQEGNSGGFDDFDFENDKGVKDEIKRAALAGETAVPTIAPPQPPTPPPAPPPPVPIPPPPPFTPGMRYVVTVPADFVNVRLSPSTVAPKLGEIPNKAVITVFEESLVNGDYWRRVHFAELIGWISLQRGAVLFAPYLGDDPSTVTIPIDLLKDIRNSLKNNADEMRRQSLALAVLSDNSLKDYEMVKAILDKIGGGA